MQLQEKINFIKSWGFEDGVPDTGMLIRLADSSVYEVWDETKPDVISLYQNDGDELFHVFNINWNLFVEVV
jgi:hypothetical protein